MYPKESPIKIALIFDQEVESGGGFQQALNTAFLVSKIDKKLGEVCIFHTRKKIKNNLNNYGINSNLIKLSYLEKFYIYLKTTKKYRVLFEFLQIFFNFNFFENFLIKQKVDIVYFLSPSRFAIDLKKLNFIFTVWDLCHRDQLEFPEVRKNNEFENREFRLNYSLPRATSIIVDSQYGKNNLLRKYKVDKKRVTVIPFEPLKDIKDEIFTKEDILNTFEKYNIKNQYLFYPAQFWPHKNHIYIIKSLYILEKKHNTILDVVFSGGDKGHKQNVIDYAKKLDVFDRIKFVGFISNKELFAHYQNCFALVMPTFFGPTNIPPLEAFKLGTPVIYSDLEGLRDEIGNAALKIDLNDPNSLANGILNLLGNKILRKSLIEAGSKFYKENEKFDRLNLLNNIILNFRTKYTNFRNY